MPYSLKGFKPSGIIYCTDGLLGGAYMIWNNAIYAAGYGETLIGCDRGHLATSELEQIDQYFWHLVFETPISQRITVSHAMETSLTNPRIMAELLHRVRLSGLKTLPRPVMGNRVKNV